MSYVFRTYSRLTASSLRQFSGRRLANSCTITSSRKENPIPVLRRPLSLTQHARKSQLNNETARETNQRDQAVHENQVKAGIEEATKQQIRRPWQREGADEPPVSDSRRNMNKSMTKGT